MTSMKAVFGAALMSAILVSSDARANLVTNGGFETGDFTGWTQGGNTGFTSVDFGIGHSGYGAKFGPAGSNASRFAKYYNHAGSNLRSVILSHPRRHDAKLFFCFVCWLHGSHFNRIPLCATYTLIHISRRGLSLQLGPLVFLSAMIGGSFLFDDDFP